MAPAYLNKTTEAVVISDEPRPDLDALARWHRISDEDAEALLAAAAERAEQPEEDQPEDEDVAKLVAFIHEHDLTAADVLAMLTAEPPQSPPGETETDAAETPTPAVKKDGADGDSKAADNSAASAESAPVEPAPAKTRARKTTTTKETES